MQNIDARLAVIARFEQGETPEQLLGTVREHEQRELENRMSQVMATLQERQRLVQEATHEVIEEMDSNPSFEAAEFQRENLHQRLDQNQRHQGCIKGVLSTQQRTLGNLTSNEIKLNQMLEKLQRSFEFHLANTSPNENLLSQAAKKINQYIAQTNS